VQEFLLNTRYNPRDACNREALCPRPPSQICIFGLPQDSFHPSSAFSTAFFCDLACSISHASAAWSSEIKTPRGPGGFAAAAAAAAATAALLLAHPLSCPPHPCVRAGVGDHMTSVRLAAVLWSAAVLYARSNVLLSNAAYSPRRRRDQGFVGALGGFDWE
jgi:hypothetical protein